MKKQGGTNVFLLLQRSTATHTDTHPYHALCERGNVLCGVVGHTSEQATEFRRSRDYKHHRLVPTDVTDIIGYGLKLLFRDRCYRTFKQSKDSVLPE